MPTYGNAATILPFPDLYASNRIAEPKVLSGGISTGNWGKGGGLAGVARTGTQAPVENTAFLKGYNLDTVPEGLQQEADVTREVLKAYSDLRSVYAGFRKKGIDLGSIDPTNPIQVEAAAIYRNLANDYLFKLNQVKQGAAYEKLIAEKQAANPNVIPAPFDNTAVVTPETVAASTATGTPLLITQWNQEGRTSAKSEEEYKQRLQDRDNILRSLDILAERGLQSPQTVELWKSQVLAPTPFTPEAVNPLEDAYLKAKIFAANSSAALAQARKKAIEDEGVGGQNAPVNALYRDAGGFINFAKQQIKSNPSYLSAVPFLDIADGTTVAKDAIINTNGKAKDQRYDLTHFGQAMSIPKSTGGGSITNILLRTKADGTPVYYIVEDSFAPETIDGRVIQKPAYTFRRINNPDVVIKSGSLAGYPIELQTLASGAKALTQVRGSDQYGGSENDNFMGQEDVQASGSGSLPILNFSNFTGAPGRTVKR